MDRKWNCKLCLIVESFSFETYQPKPNHHPLLAVRTFGLLCNHFLWLLVLVPADNSFVVPQFGCSDRSNLAMLRTFVASMLMDHNIEKSRAVKENNTHKI
jgi:hypothetical protein